MDDELAAMNASLDQAQGDFMDEEDKSEPHKKIEIDSDPEQKSQEVVDENGTIDEKDEISLDPENSSTINKIEPDAKSTDSKAVKTTEEDESETQDDNQSEHDEEGSNKGDDQSEHSQDDQENNDPSTELQDKAADNLKEGDESIFKSKNELKKDDAVIDDAPEAKDDDEEKSREGVSRMLTTILFSAFMMILA
jgi:hypothetical protein